MSGHSKWSQIKHQKGAADIKRGQAFTKIGNAITLAVREGGGIADPNSNFHLRLAIEKARQANMPKVNIERAIERGLGKGEGAHLEEVIYEGFGPGKVSIIIQAATDNRQRTYAKLKNLFSEYGGSLSGPGSVSYLFQNMGEIKVKKVNLDSDRYMEIALDTGCSDIEILNEVVIFYCQVSQIHKIKENLGKKGLQIMDSELIFRPLTTVKIDDKGIAQKILNLMTKLEGDDDIQKVSANFDINQQLQDALIV